MQTIEQTLDSREVAEMVDKEHRKLLKDMVIVKKCVVNSKLN